MPACMPQADVYSFGIVVWELCTLRKPFGGMSSHEHARKVRVCIAYARVEVEVEVDLGAKTLLLWTCLLHLVCSFGCD